MKSFKPFEDYRFIGKKNQGAHKLESTQFHLRMKYENVFFLRTLTLRIRHIPVLLLTFTITLREKGTDSQRNVYMLRKDGLL